MKNPLYRIKIENKHGLCIHMWMTFLYASISVCFYHEQKMPAKLLKFTSSFTYKTNSKLCVFCSSHSWIFIPPVVFFISAMQCGQSLQHFMSRAIWPLQFIMSSLSLLYSIQLGKWSVASQNNCFIFLMCCSLI